MGKKSKVKTEKPKEEKKKDLKKKPPKKEIFKEYAKTLIVAVIAALFLRETVITSYTVPTSSMEDTILVGDFLIANRFIYGSRIPIIGLRLPAFKQPQPGDIIVCKFIGDKITSIKRCIAIEGQTVEIRDKIVFVDGKKFPDSVLGKHIDSHIMPKDYKEEGVLPPGSGNRDNYGPVTVPKDHVFAMGDNRDISKDSRYLGFIPKDRILGEGMIFWFSWDPNVPLYKIFKKVRWNRIGKLLK